MGNPRENRVFDFEDFRLDAAHLLLYHNGKEVPLTPKAVATLLALLERPGEVVSKNDLMQIIWADTVVEESNLAQYLHLVRKTLGRRRDGNQFIETLKRRGYRFSGVVTISESNYAADRREETKPDLPSEVRHSADIHSRVERRGNVLALVDWRENKVDTAEVAVEAAESRGLIPLQQVPSFRRWWLAGAAAGAILLTLAISLLWLNSSSGEIRTGSKGDLTLLNLTSGELVESATISPDGNYFVYASSEGEMVSLWLQQTGQANRTEVISPFAGVIYGTTFTPDSKFIYLVVSDAPGAANTLYSIPTLGGVRTKILSDLNGPVSFSPDGHELVFTRFDKNASRTALVIALSDGSQERVVLTRADDEAIDNGAWSPDGKLIAYSAINTKINDGRCEIKGVDLDSGEIRMLSHERWDTCFRMAWTHDGKGLVFPGTKFREALTTRRDQIFYLSIDNGESRRLTTEGNRHQYASLGVTDRDEILVVPFNRSSQIWSMDAAGDSRTAIQLTTGQTDGRGGIEPLADGSVAYLTRNGDGFSIWRMNSDGMDRKQVTTNPPAIEELRAARDGRFFIFATTLDRYSHLYRVDSSGENLKQLTYGDRQEIDSAVSPDGNWIVYNSKTFDGYGKAAMWKVSSDGGEPTRMADIECGSPHFSPDGRFITCASNHLKKISVIDAKDGFVVKSFDAGKNAILNVGARWTPDGRSIAYVVFEHNLTNIWIQPTSGDAKYNLTNFTSGEIYNFAFGVDDSRLYLARGHSIRNAILISNFK